MLPPQAGGKTGMFVEQYLPSLATRASQRFADYVSVESLVLAADQPYGGDRAVPAGRAFRETGFFIPADLPHAQLAAVLKVATAALHALGVRTGGFHTEIKLTRPVRG